MPTSQTFKHETKKKNLVLRVVRGHFATSHSHSNYYIDVVAQKSNLSEARAVASELRSYYYSNTLVDTILCLDGTEVIGTCLGNELTKADFTNVNAHKPINIITPEATNTSQLLFRDNTVPMISGKRVLILAVSVATGRTVEAAVDAVRYYGGQVAGICSIFATVEECAGFPVHSAFNPKDLPDYGCYTSGNCPMCKRGEKIDALVNCYGFSKI